MILPNLQPYMRFVATGVILLLANTPVAADFPAIEADGWHTWRVTAAADTPNWCCYSWNSGVAQRKSCDLDNGHGGYSSDDDSVNTSGEMQIYAFMKSGTATDIRPLSSQCSVKSQSTITDLGVVDVDDSTRYLQPYIHAGKDLGSDTLAAISAHDGKTSLSILLDSAQSGVDLETRKEAVFWTALVRGSEAANDIKKMMYEDRNAEFREHAAFSYSQSDIADRADALIRLGNEDSNAEVRSQAWFWLAQTEANESEAAISYAISHDKNRDVREEAVFALSQLPEERAVTALAAILENRKFDKSIREEALFWLAQSDSDTAFTYVDRLLSGQ